MPSCVVKWCKNNSCFQNKLSGITFHKFPTDSSCSRKWIKAIRDSRDDEDWLPSKFSVICSLHFEESDMYYTKRGLRRVRKNSIPKKVIKSIAITENEKCDLEASTTGLNTEVIKTIAITENEKWDLEASTSGLNQALSLHPEPEIPDSDIESLLDTPKKSKLKQELTNCRRRLKMQSRKLKILYQKVRRLKKRNTSLKNILKYLKDKSYIATDVFNLLGGKYRRSEFIRININKNIK